MADEIIKELWKIKDGIANEYGYDVKALVAYLRAKKHEGDQQVVDLRAMKQTAEQKFGLDPQTKGESYAMEKCFINFRACNLYHINKLGWER